MRQYARPTQRCRNAELVQALYRLGQLPRATGISSLAPWRTPTSWRWSSLYPTGAGFKVKRPAQSCVDASVRSRYSRKANYRSGSGVASRIGPRRSQILGVRVHRIGSAPQRRSDHAPLDWAGQRLPAPRAGAPVFFRPAGRSRYRRIDTALNPALELLIGGVAFWSDTHEAPQGTGGPFA